MTSLEIRGSEEVASALRNFGGENEQLVLPSWRFLCGLKLKGNDPTLANVTKDQLDSSNEFAAVLGAPGGLGVSGTVMVFVSGARYKQPASQRQYDAPLVSLQNLENARRASYLGSVAELEEERSIVSDLL